MNITVLALFDHIEETARAIKPLEEMSVPHRDIRLLSTAPYPEGTLFHDKTPTPLWLTALCGGVIGFFVAVGLAGVTQWLINITVSGKPTFAFPPIAVICYEFTLLGAVLGTFLGLLYMAHLPDWGDLAYDPEISRCKVGLLVRCDTEDAAAKVEQLLRDHHAIKIKKGRDDF